MLRSRGEVATVSPADKAAGDTGAGMNRIEDLRELVAEDPEDALAWFMLGTELGKEGRFAEAREALARVVALDEGYSAAWRALAEARERLGEDAGDTWERARRCAEAKGDQVVLRAAERALERIAGATGEGS